MFLLFIEDLVVAGDFEFAFHVLQLLNEFVPIYSKIRNKTNMFVIAKNHDIWFLSWIHAASVLLRTNHVQRIALLIVNSSYGYSYLLLFENTVYCLLQNISLPWYKVRDELFGGINFITITFKLWVKHTVSRILFEGHIIRYFDLDV